MPVTPATAEHAPEAAPTGATGAPSLDLGSPGPVTPSRGGTTAEQAAGRAQVAGLALVVDDEPAIRGLLEALLRRGGWDVVCASDRAEALAAVAAASFDAVLLDLRLADVDGRDLLVELSEAAPGVREVAAFVTGAPPADGRVAGRPVLGKPFAWTQLAALLEQIRR